MNPSNAKVISIVAKCSDCCSVDLLDDIGNQLASRDGYVPEFMPGDHYGDYIMIDIELATGKILNWKVPTTEDLENVKWD
jgi:hypothetical protein